MCWKDQLLIKGAKRAKLQKILDATSIPLVLGYETGNRSLYQFGGNKVDQCDSDDEC